MEETTQQATPQPSPPPDDSQPKMFGATIIVSVIGKFLQAIGKIFGQKFFDSTAYFFTVLGHWATLVAAALWFIFCLITAIAVKPEVLAVAFRVRMSVGMLIVSGLVGAAVILILQYVASRFLASGERLIKTSPSSMASKGYLECVGLLLLISGVVVFILGIVQLFYGQVGSFFGGVAWLVITVYWTCFALNPGMVNIQITEESSAGQEFIGILSFWAKSALKLVPIAFGVAISLSCILLVVATIMSAAGGLTGARGAALGSWAGDLVGLGLLLPLLAYMGFLAYYLAIDLILAILKLPRLLEKR
jgi:hypothetical protein